MIQLIKDFFMDGDVLMGLFILALGFAIYVMAMKLSNDLIRKLDVQQQKATKQAQSSALLYL